MESLSLDHDKHGIIARELNNTLANYHIYYQNLRNFHWNIQGENFFELHELFEDLYNDARERIDEIAERILTIGYRPVSQFSRYLEMATIREAKPIIEDKKMVSTILSQQKIILSQMQKTISSARKVEDNGTVYLMSKFVEKIEKQNWMLKTWLRPVTKSQKALLDA